MKKRLPLILVGLLFFAGVVGSIWVMQTPDTNMVEIVQNGQCLYRINLAESEDRIIEISYEGRKNVVEIKAHKIRMREAECPDHTCVHMGWLKSAAPIVCLPNHLVIQLVDDTELLDGAA